MKVSRLLATLFVAAVAAAFSLEAGAQEKIKIGVPVDFTGASAPLGARIKQAVELFQDDNGTKIGGRDVEVIFRDITNGNAAVAKQVTEELILRDHVSLIVGLITTPEVAAIASLVTQAKVPTIPLIASTPILMGLSPFIVRACNNMVSTVLPAAEWAYKNGKRRAYIAVMDFSPGYEVQETFKKRFTELGGQVVGEDRVPTSTVDFSPVVERIIRSDADVVQVFILSGSPSVAFIRALSAQGAFKQDKTFIGLVETDDSDLPAFDDSVIGVVSSFPYAPTLDNPENRKFKASYLKKFGTLVGLGYAHASAYDGMRVAYRMIESQQGKPFDGAAAVEAVKGYTWNGPRGPITIDPATRDVIENLYIRRVEKVDGRLQNVVIDTFPHMMPGVKKAGQ